MLHRFFRPERLSDLTRALEELDRCSAGDMREVWGHGARGAHTKWSQLRLPRPLLHPAAPRLWADAAGVSADALFAVQRTDAFVAGDGTLTLWPWYREEDALARPLAEAESATTGLALPADFLDEPYDPSYYLKRSGQGAVQALLAARGVAGADVGFVDRVPVPPRRGFEPVAYEGGLTAAPIAEQRFVALARWVERAADLDEDDLAELEPILAHAFAEVVAAMGGDHTRAARAPRPVEPPPVVEEIPAVGRAIAVWAVDGGALLETEGRIIEVAADGSFSWAIVARARIGFATAHGADVEGHLLDLRARTWRTGDHGAIAAELGLPDVGDVEESYRHTPARSSCGLYGLDTDEMPFIQRLADRVEVASGRALERWFGEGSKARGLIRPEDVEVGESVTLDGVRFTLRNASPSAMEGRSPSAFALWRKGAGDRGRWRVLWEGAVRDGKRVLARVGVSPLGAAFTADGSRLWVLLPDHLGRIDLDEPRPRVAVLVPLAPILAAAEAP